MFGLLMRIKMRLYLSKIEKMCFQQESGIISGDAVLKFCSSPKKLKVLKALEASQCISLIWIDGYKFPACIREGEKSALYTLERSEIWLNRFLGFIAGILTAVFTDILIRLL